MGPYDEEMERYPNPYRVGAGPGPSDPPPPRRSTLRVVGAILMWCASAMAWAWSGLWLTILIGEAASSADTEWPFVVLLALLFASPALLCTALAVWLTRRPRRRVRRSEVPLWWPV